MKVQYSERVKQWEEGLKLAQQGTRRLEEVIGPSAAQATAEWDRTEDEKGRALFTIRLSDFTGEVTARLAPDELQSPTQTSFRMQRLWGDLLQLQINRKLDELLGRERGNEN